MSLVEYVYQQPSPCRKVYKASIFRNKQLRFPSRIFYEDLSLAPCLVSEVKSIGVIQEKLYFYVQHKSSTMHSKDVNRILDILSAFDFIMSYYKDNNLLDKYHSEIEWLAIQHVLYYSCCRISFIECNATAAEQLISYMNTNFPEYKNTKYIDTPNECVIREEIDALINNGYIAFDKCYYSKKRIVNRIKSVIKKIFVNCNNKLNTYQAEIR